MTDSAYRPLSAAEQIFKDLVWIPSLKAGELALDGVAPFLATPVIHGIEDQVFSEISDWLFNKFRLFVDVEAIRMLDSEHQKEYASASLKLKVLAHDQGMDSDAFKAAREAAKADLSRFTQLTGR